MKRLWTIALAAGLAACKVEQTPAEYIDHADPIDVEREAAVDEIRDRVLAMGQALGRDNPAEALTALSPAQDSYLFLPTHDTLLAGPAEISGALQDLAERAGDLRMRDVEVTVGPRANIAWFRALLEVGGEPTLEGVPLRLTGVYVLDEGLWELVQAHLSLPFTPPPPPSPDGGAAPVEGG